MFLPFYRYGESFDCRCNTFFGKANHCIYRYVLISNNSTGSDYRTIIIIFSLIFLVSFFLFLFFLSIFILFFIHYFILFIYYFIYLFIYLLFYLFIYLFIYLFFRVFKLVPSTMIGYIICAFVFPVPIYNFVSKSWLFSILLCLQLFVYQLIYKFDRLKIVWRLTVIRSIIDYRPIVLYILYPLFTIFLVYLLGRHYAVYQRSSIVYDRTRLRLDFKHEASSVFDEFSTIVRNMLN